MVWKKSRDINQVDYKKYPSSQTSNGTKIGAILVVGGGIAGMQASLDMANAGYKVYLVEAKAAIGGHMAALDKTFPTNDCAMCTISPRLVSTASHHNIEVLTRSELIRLEGIAGNFTASILHKPRYINIDKCTACGDCASVCPIEIIDEFNVGLNKRKAAYKLYPQAVPNAYTIEKKGIAPCRDACPAGQRAQGYIALIRAGRYEDALRVIKEDNPFPGICGRICNHRCEPECNRNLVDEPIAIASLKRFVTDQVYSIPYKSPELAIRKFDERVAIIGAGPCGLTAAKDLVLAGYGVTVYEALPVAGGMLRVGVPEFRLPTRIVNREVQEIIDLGIELRLNTRVENIDDLFTEGYSAILIAVGAHQGKRLPIPGANHPEVMTAINFLRDFNLGNGADIQGRHVLILGGGNVAIDCARTAVRMGAKQVNVSCLESYESMPADIQEIIEAKDEGISFFPSKSFTKICSENGQITGVEAEDVTFFQFNQDGSLKLETAPRSEQLLPCDTIIFAIGQQAGLAFIPQDSDVGLTQQETVAINPNTYATSHKGVFAAGDATVGTAFVIEAVASGHNAAKSIIKYIKGEPLETREHKKLPVVRFSKSEITDLIQREKIKIQPRVRMLTLEPTNRTKTFMEVNLGYSKEEAKRESERCLQCGICSECLCCEYKCVAGAINHNETEYVEKVDVGAVILATGFETADPKLSSEYGYGRFPNVVTSMQYERILSPSGPYHGHLKRLSDSKEPKRIAWIQCVGSRRADRNWCSAVCCMYSIKQAIITKEHKPDTEVSVFYIDFRAYGKNFDAYYQRSKEIGTRFIRAIPSEIRQDPKTENLELLYALPDGSLTNETFDMVVLSVGMQAPTNMVNLSNDLEINLTPQGFCQTTNFSPLNTTREGVYVCGPFAEPKDIPETVMSASAAAVKAMTLLADARFTLVSEKEYPPEIDISGQDPRVGVFVCHCGTNIAGIVDVQSVTDYARNLPDVVMADNTLFTCSTDSQAKIREAIKEFELNRVVVASCTPRTHEKLFQSTIREAGLNFYLFEMANIRDQCSWVHRDFPVQATAKAKDLVRMAVAKVRLFEPLNRKTLEFNHDALIIGGGLAGMTSALQLAKQGFQVVLVERDNELGGNMRHLQFLLSHKNPQKYLGNLISNINNNSNIHVLLGAEVGSFEGSIGKFKSEIHFNGKSILADNGDSSQTINHGVTIVATGGKPYKPVEYRYGVDPRVITQTELENVLTNPNMEFLDQNSNDPSTIVMIQCVGSRTPERPYCSRLCCSQAIKNAIEIKRISPLNEVYILYRDIRTYGLLEQYYRNARNIGVIFQRFNEKQPPEVSTNNGAEKPLQVKIYDAMLSSEIIIEADKVVLSVATVPQDDAAELAQKLKIPLTADGFFQEAHMKLAPVDFANEGIFLCGMAHYPKKAVTESVIQALAAAGRATTVLAKQVIEIEPTISHVMEEKCDGCAYCIDPCLYNAITLIDYTDENGKLKKRVMIDETVCKGCGTCQATCPKDGIFVSHFRLDQLRAMTMAALEI